MLIKTAEFVTSAFKASGYPPDELPEIAFAGRSNVGKSSLMNALLNRKKLVKTSSRPGKTQSINFFDINQAWRFVDLPGYGYAKVPQEIKKTWGPMMDTYFQTRKLLRLVVCLVDCRRGIGDMDAQLFTLLDGYQRHRILVFTKFDKLKKNEQNNFHRSQETKFGLNRRDYFTVSSQSGHGIENLWSEIGIYLADIDAGT